MPFESLGVHADQEKGIHVDPDSHLHYSLLELKEIVSASDLDLEKSFEAKEADMETVELAIAHYESMMNDEKAFVGIGTTALVYKQHPEIEPSERCVKCRWDFLMVNNKSKRTDNLPENLRPLKAIEKHFAKVGEEKKELRRRTKLDLLPDNNVLREAMIQRLAHTALAQAGWEHAVPDVDFIVKIEREESGDVNGDPYAASESVNLMFMEQVPGMNMEEMIRHPSRHMADAIDADRIEQQLMAMVEALHKEGIAHRDLSLRNIMLGSEAFEPHIIDFGRSIHASILSAEEKERDMQCVRDAVRFLRKFKEDPAQAALDLAEMQAI